MEHTGAIWNNSFNICSVMTKKIAPVAIPNANTAVGDAPKERIKHVTASCDVGFRSIAAGSLEVVHLHASTLHGATSLI